MPDGPDNGRSCVFSSEADALAWAREEYAPESFDPANFRYLPVPSWHDPDPSPMHWMTDALLPLCEGSESPYTRMVPVWEDVTCSACLQRRGSAKEG